MLSFIVEVVAVVTYGEHRWQYMCWCSRYVDSMSGFEALWIVSKRKEPTFVTGLAGRLRELRGHALVLWTSRVGVASLDVIRFGLIFFSMQTVSLGIDSIWRISYLIRNVCICHRCKSHKLAQCWCIHGTAYVNRMYLLCLSDILCKHRELSIKHPALLDISWI